MYKKNIIGCGGIIISNEFNNILCVMNKYTYKAKEYKWGLPKGRIENNETYLECAKREIYEETGLKFPNSRFRVYYPMINSIMYIIHLKIKKDNFLINDDSEIQFVEWKNIDDIKSDILNNKNSYNREIKCLVKALSNKNTSTLRKLYCNYKNY